MPRSAGSRLLRAALLVSLPLLGGACDAVREARDATYTWHGTPMDPAREAPPLALTGGGGQPFDLAAQRGKVTLVFFGYTRCPDVCPTTLADWSRARAALGADTAGVRFVFVSVDPERDTPADADAYARRFHPAFVGVSGTPGEVAAVTGRWGVLAAPEAGGADAAADAPGHAGHDAGASAAAPPASTPAGATLAHTARTFLVDQAGRLRVLYPQGTAPAGLAADLRHLLD